MKKISLFLFLVVSLSVFSQTYTTGTVTLTSTAGLAMSIKLDVGANVTMTLTGPSARWFAVGFNASSMAAGTDVAAVHTAGTLTNFDANLTGYSAPATDAQQNWIITSNTVTSGVRTVIATRALNTGDANDYTFTAAPGSISLIWARASSNTFTYAYHGNTNRGISSATFTLVPVTPPPTGNSPQTVCAGATLNQLQVTGSSIQWYANASGGSPISNATPLVNGATYYASQTVSGQESQTRLAVTVTLQYPPASAPALQNIPTSICANQNNVSLIASAVPGAITYNWIIDGQSTNTLVPSTNVTPTFGISTIPISVAASNQCGIGPNATAVIQVNPIYAFFTNATTCDTLVWNGQVLTQSGVYTYQGQTQAGCDSNWTLQLTVLENTVTTISHIQCYPLSANGQIYTQSGNYQQVLTSVLGCDSIVNIQFTLLPSDTVITEYIACDTAFIAGFTFLNSNLFTQHLTNAYGCDSVIIWDIQINQSTPPTIIDSTVVSSIEWYNQTLTQSGVYTQTFQNVFGCDSSIVLNLTVLTNSLDETEFDLPIPTILRQGDILHIPFANWHFMDMNGRELSRGNLTDFQLRMDVLPGIYFIRNERKSVKIIIIE